MLACLLVGSSLAGVSLASRGHEYSTSFGELCTSSPCIGGALKKPNGVAVNEATGDVYVADEAENRVVRFSKEGVFESEFNGSGLLSGEGTAAGGGSQPGEVPTGLFDKPQTIAVDNSCFRQQLSQSKCEAQDPSNGDVYVVDAGHEVIDKYSAGGEYVGQITEGEGGRFTRALDGVAVNPLGRVWVYQENRIVSQYDDGRPNAFIGHTPEISLPTFPLPGLAVDSKGNLYLREGEQEAGHVLRSRITKVASATGIVVKPEMDSEESSAVATDQSNNNDVFVDNLTSIGVFNSEGEEIERLGEEHGEKHLLEGAGVGVDAGAGKVYVADAATGKVVVFAPQAPSAPTVGGEFVAETTSVGAVLGAEVNPRSEPGEAQTEYSFRYGACPSLESCPQSGYEASAPAPAGRLSPDFAVHPVSATLSALKPNAIYHFTIFARNSNGSVEGEERTFRTQGSGGAVAPPDDRGWELVSPPDKLGALIEPITNGGVIEAAASGDAITYLTNAPLVSEPQGAANMSQVLSRRAHASWSTRDISLPHVSATAFGFAEGQEHKFFNPELTLSAVQPFGEFNPLLSNEASESTAYLHDLEEGCRDSCYRPLVTGKPGYANVPEGTQFGEADACKPKVAGTGETKVTCGPQFLGATEGLEHVVLRSTAVLTAGGPAPGLYEWSEGRLAPVSVLPGGEGAGESGLGLYHAGASVSARNAISTDGSHVFWSTSSALYLRYLPSGGREETIQLDQAEIGCGSCVSGGGQFQIASSDGSRVFFTDMNKLTSDSGAQPEHKADLYECQIVTSPKLACELTDVTPKRISGPGPEEEAADVLGNVLGASEDGSYLYFVAGGKQSGPNPEGKGPEGSKPNLYLHHDGTTSFIATLASGDEHDWDISEGTAAPLSGQPTRVSANGFFLALMSEASLTGYDNRAAKGGTPTAEVYLFDVETGKLSCASCDPTGARPEGVEYHKLEPGSGGLVGGPRGIWPAQSLVAANVPGWTAMIGGVSRYQPRYLNDLGRLFFNTVNPLVAQDTNGNQDVYEFEPPGVGSCAATSELYSSRSGGCVGLISSGSSAQESAFLDASESGDDVFFLTSAKLSSIDTDNAFDVYDAHVCTSAEPCIAYTVQEEPSCESEFACKAPLAPQPSIFGAPPSATFTGPANIVPVPPKARVKSPEEVRIEKLNKALKACRAKKGAKKRQVTKKRKACEASARKRYAKPGSKKAARKVKTKRERKK